MTKRRGMIALALAAGMSIGAVAPATAQTNSTSSELDQLSSTNNTNSGSSTAQTLQELGSTDSSSQAAAKDFDGLSPIVKFIIGVFGASAVFALLGMLRTLVWNVAGV